jgi:hypothetical protein
LHGVEQAACDTELLHQANGNSGHFVLYRELQEAFFGDRRPAQRSRIGRLFERNSKASFPDKASAYAKYAYELIRDARRELLTLDAENVRKVEWRNMRRGHDAIEKKVGPVEPDGQGRYWGIGSSHISTMLSTVVQGEPTDFESQLKAVEERMWIWGF